MIAHPTAQPFIREAEWEYLSERKTFDRLATPPVWLPGPLISVVVERDEHYHVRVICEGIVDRNALKRSEDALGRGVAGTKAETTDVRVEDSNSGEHCFLRSICLNRTTLKSTPDCRQTYRLEATAISAEFVTPSSNGVVAWYSDWLLNGPSELHGVLMEATKRETTTQVKRSRTDGRGGYEHQAYSASQTSIDHLSIPGIGAIPSFVLSHVPSESGVGWSRCMALEYSNNLAGDLHAEMRRGIVEFLSFMLGKHLMCVGTSEMTGEGLVVRAEARGPWGRGIVDESKQHAEPPVPLGWYNGQRAYALEELVKAMLPGYLNLRETLGLKDVLWALWMAKHVPVGPNISIVCGGIEAAKTAWLKSNKSKSHGNFIPQAEFNELTSNSLSIVERDLSGHPAAAVVLRKMQGAWQMGVADQMRTFFEETELPLAERERQALRLRNKSAHGNYGSPDTTEEFLRAYRCLETLANRIVLKALGFNGMYIDYGSPTFPLRDLLKPDG